MESDEGVRDLTHAVWYMVPSIGDVMYLQCFKNMPKASALKLNTAYIYSIVINYTTDQWNFDTYFEHWNTTVFCQLLNKCTVKVKCSVLNTSILNTTLNTLQVFCTCI